MPVTGPAQSRRLVLVGELGFDDVEQVVVAAAGDAADLDGAVGAGGLGVQTQPGGDLVDDHRVLLAFVLGVGEDVGQQFLGAELVQGPPEGVDAGGAAGDLRTAGGVVGDRRAEERGGLERLGGQAELGVLGAQVVVELDVGVVEEQQVLALDGEDQRLGVDRALAQCAGAEQRVQQEQCVAGLGGDAGDAADRDVGAAGAVQEVDVEVDGFAVAAAPGGELAVHVVEVQGVGALVAGGAVGGGAGAGRDVDLGFDPGGGDLGGLLDGGRQHAVADQEDVGGEAGAFVAGGDLGDDAGGGDRADAGDVAGGDDDVVELQVAVGGQRDVELQRGGVLAAQDAGERLGFRLERGMVRLGIRHDEAPLVSACSAGPARRYAPKPGAVKARSPRRSPAAMMPLAISADLGTLRSLL